MDAPTASRHHRIETGVLVLLALAVGPAESRAQRSHDASPVAAVGGALVGGTAGLLAGVVIGARDCREFCYEIAVGAVAGEILGVALGAHLFNRGRGNLLADLLASSVIGLGGIAVVEETDLDGGMILLATAAVQLYGVVLAEVMSSPAVTVGAEVQRTSNGVGIGVRVRW